MSIVFIGSEAPIQPPLGLHATVNEEGAQVSNPSDDLPERTIVVIDTPDFDADGNKVPLDKKLAEVRRAFAIHSEKPAPWVECHDEFFGNAVKELFEGATVGRPEGWEPTKATRPETQTIEASDVAPVPSEVQSGEATQQTEGDQGEVA